MDKGDQEKDDRITVVSGIPRSGTSLVMQMLEAAGLEALSDAQRPPDASNPKGYFELEAVKRMPSQGAPWISQARGRAIKVIHALLPHLPRDERYRVLFVVRDLDEVIASQNHMLERLGESAGPLPLERLRALLEQQLDEARALLEAQPCFEWLEISHRELIDEPEEVSRRIAAFLYRPEARDAMTACIDPSLHHERGG